MVEFGPEILEKLSKMNRTEIQNFLDEMLHQFALTGDEKYEGVYPLLIIFYTKIYPILQEIATFAHGLTVLEGQVMKYLDTMGAGINDVESFFKEVEKIRL